MLNWPVHNLINRQAGCPLDLPPSQSGPAFLSPLAAVLALPGRLGTQGIEVVPPQGDVRAIVSLGDEVVHLGEDEG
jgi:hypothetical protein